MAILPELPRAPFSPAEVAAAGGVAVVAVAATLSDPEPGCVAAFFISLLLLLTPGVGVEDFRLPFVLEFIALRDYQGASV
jgi:hypothetical protein